MSNRSFLRPPVADGGPADGAEGRDRANPRVRALVIAIVVVVFTAAGCSRPGPQISQATVTIGSLTYRVEVARTAEEQQEGLAGRQALTDGTGMLFVFGGRGEHQVWMAGMTIPLDIAWISRDEILAVDTLYPCDEPDQNRCPRWTSPGPVDALLEVSAHSLGGVGANTRVAITEQSS